MENTYLVDFNTWLSETAQLIRDRHWQEIDIEHLVEELESLGKSENEVFPVN